MTARRLKPRQGRKPDEPPPAMLSVTDGHICVGFILNRGSRGFEAFTAAGKSIGLFPDQQMAVRAIPAIAIATARHQTKEQRQ